MRRLSTPTHTFTLAISTDDIAKIRITYAQKGREVLVKETKDISLEGNKAVVKLMQEETKGFSSNSNAEVQLHVITKGGDSLLSDIYDISVLRVLNDEVL